MLSAHAIGKAGVQGGQLRQSGKREHAEGRAFLMPISGGEWMAIVQNLSMMRGDTFAFYLALEDIDYEAVKQIYFTCKRSATDGAPLFQKRLGRGITLAEVESESGETLYYVRIAPSDTASIKAGWYAYDIEINIGDEVFTPIKGRIHIDQDVTN